MRFPHLLTTELLDGGNRKWCASLGISALVHASLIVAAGWYWIDSRDPSGSSVLETRWSAATLHTEFYDSLEPIELQQTKPEPIENASTASLSLKRADSRYLEVRPPTEDVVAAALTINDSTYDGTDYTEQVALWSEGSGSGDSEGSGDGFFGISAPGKRFVYVVDCSRSMNHPHPGEAKTRFGRLKLEILRSVAGMDSSQQFFIIYFNDQAIPMPASSPQQAIPQYQKRYLGWMSKMHADGETDPRDALTMALKLQPDVIYFLTDGRFKPKIEADLKRLSQPDVAIHTYAFGERHAEKIMRAVAAANGGQYKYIP